MNYGMAHLNGPDDGLRELALFAGAGGGILGGKLLGWRTVCAVEWEPYPAAVLARRQDEGFLPPFPIWDDVQTFDGRPWRGLVDVVSGGFPCQDISAAGKGAGITGERSGMWSHMARIIGEVRPRYAFVENSPMLTSRGLDKVLGDLSTLGYDAVWGVVSAADAGAPHRRERIWILAYAVRNGCYADKGRQSIHDGNGIGSAHATGRQELEQGACCASEHPIGQLADANGTQCEGNERAERSHQERAYISEPSWWSTEPNVGRVADGVAARVDRLKAIGNGQVPAVVRLAWNTLHERLMTR